MTLWGALNDENVVRRYGIRNTHYGSFSEQYLVRRDHFNDYVKGMRRLLLSLGKDHPRIAEVLVLQHRLRENLTATMKHGMTATLDASRDRILESCNRISLALTGKPFYAFCGLPEPAVTRAVDPAKAGLDRQHQVTLDVYFDLMNDLLTEKSLRTAQATSEVRSIARTHTLEVLQNLGDDGVRKGRVLQFLYEAGLITQGPGVIFLAEADLSGVYLNGASLVEAHLAETHLENAYLEHAHLEWARLGEAHLAGAHLKGAFLVAAHLGNADLTGADMGGARLVGTNLAGAHLVGANLEGACLQWANLVAANLMGAILSEANLEGAELKWANLARANLAGADLEDTHLTWARLRGAIYDARTRWPAGFDPIPAGAEMMRTGQDGNGSKE